MSVQTSVTDHLALAIEGGIHTFESERARLAAVAMQNGRLAVKGATDTTCKLPTAAGDLANPIGITPYKPTSTVGIFGQTTEYASGDTVSAVSRGKVWVRVEAAVTAGDPVYVRHTARGAYTALGAFRGDADTVAYTDYCGLLAGAEYLTSATADNLALVEINLP